MISCHKAMSAGGAQVCSLFHWHFASEPLPAAAPRLCAIGACVCIRTKTRTIDFNFVYGYDNSANSFFHFQENTGHRAMFKTWHKLAVASLLSKLERGSRRKVICAQPQPSLLLLSLVITLNLAQATFFCYVACLASCR